MARSPQWHHLVLLLLLSLCVLLLYCHSNASLPASIAASRNPNRDGPRLLPDPRPKAAAAAAAAGPPNFTLLIKVLAFNRLDSLSRCLRSLAAADYLSDTVHLHVYIDHFGNGSGDVGSSVDAARRILDFVDGFEWGFGEKRVHYRTANAGLQAQWLEAWWPSSDDEFAFIVEDDLEVSPLFYKFVKSVIWNFYYNASNFSPMVYGVTLQRPRFVPGKHGNKLQVDGRSQVFLYQLVGTWGQILFPKHWKEFRRWYDYHKAKGIKPILEGMVTTGWYRRLGEKIWTPWFIKFIHDRGYFNIYTNFLQERALSVSHRDTGVNYGKTAGPDSHLLNEAPHDFNLLEMQPLSNLKWYDFCFREVLPGRVIRNFNDLGVVLDTVQINETIVFVSLFGLQEIIVRNMLCHLERLNIRNYILMGPTSNLLFDLARRGHPVIDADQFLDSVGANKLKRPQNSSPELIKNVMTSTYAIKKCLELKYNAWVVDANMLFPNGGMFQALTDSTFDLYAGKSLALIFVRSSSAVRKLWLDNFVHAIEAGDSLWDKLSISRENSNFADIAASFLESKRVRVKRIDDRSLGVNIGTSSVERASPGLENKVLYWSPDAALDIIRKRLEELKMWTLDGDDSCSAVVCHQS